MSLAGTAPPVGGGRIAWLMALVPALAFLVGGSLWAFLAPSLPKPPAPVIAAKGLPVKAAAPVKAQAAPRPPLKVPAAATARASAIGAAIHAMAPPVVKTAR